MKLLLILALAVAVLYVWFRTGLRSKLSGRGPLLEFAMFIVVLSGLFGLMLLSARLF